MGFFKSVFKAVLSMAITAGLTAMGVPPQFTIGTFEISTATIVMFGTGAVMAATTKQRNSSLTDNVYSSHLRNRSLMVKQPISARSTVYGTTKKSGAILYMDTTNKNKDAHIVIELASHEINDITEVYFDDQELTLTSTGNDANGIARLRPTAPDKYAKKNKFQNDITSFPISNYSVIRTFDEDDPRFQYRSSKLGLARGIDRVTLISDEAFSCSTSDVINIGGADFNVTNNASSSTVNGRQELVVQFSPTLDRTIEAYQIIQDSPNGKQLIDFYRENRDAPRPFQSVATTPLDFAIIARLNKGASNFSVRVKKHLGSDSQLADADMVSEIPDWTVDHRLSGIAYLYVRLSFDGSMFPNGLPNISATIQGKKVFDMRDDSTSFSDNPALCIRDYLTDTRLGLGIPSANIDDTTFTEVANDSDSNITLATGGTEKKYTCNGIVYNDIQPMQILTDLTSSFSGNITYSNGKFMLKGGRFVAPVETLSDGATIGDLSITTKQSRRNLFNTVKGVFTSEESNWMPTDYPAVTSSTFVTEDGEQIISDIDLPFTTSSSMAQRIAKIALFKNRQQQTIQGFFSLKAFRVMVGDTLTMRHDRLGIDGTFEVTDWQLVTEPQRVGIALTMTEVSSAVYDWNAEESEFLFDNTTLPSPEDITPPSIEVADVLRNLQSNIQTVLTIVCRSSQGNTAEFEVEYRNTNYNDQFITLGRSFNNRFEILNVGDGEVYEIRARSINDFNVASDFTTITHTVVGKNAPPADVSNFAVNIVDGQANCRWNRVNELDLSHYIIRHSPLSTGAKYSESSIVADNINKNTNSISFAGEAGTYFIKAVDVLGNVSTNPTSSRIIVDNIRHGFNVVLNQVESPNFSGTRDKTVIVDRSGTDHLELPTEGGLFDSATGLFDSASGLFEDGADAEPPLSGTYDFAPIDIGGIFTSRISCINEFNRVDTTTNFDTKAGFFDEATGFFEGNTQDSEDDCNVQMQISTSEDNSTFTDFRDFIAGDYKARFIKIRAVLSTTRQLITPSVKTLSVSVDMPDRTFAEDDIASTTNAGGKVITFNPAFKQLQGLGISATNLSTGDFYEITSKSATGFTIKFKNSGGSVIDKTFGYTAKGFGFLET